MQHTIEPSEAKYETFVKQLTYWKQQLAGAPPVLDLPTDRPRPPVQSYRRSMLPFILSGELTAALKTLSRRESVTLSMTLTAAFQALLHRYTGQDDLLLGLLTASPEHAEAQNMGGDFLNTVVLRIDLAGNPTFLELLKRTRDVSMSACRHADVPFEALVRELQPEQSLSYQPLVQVILAYQPQLPILPAGWTVSQTNLQTHISKFDLSLELDDRPEGLTGRFIYNTDLFDASTISRTIGHWQTLLEGVSVNPAQHLAELPLLTEEEEHLLLVDWNDTASSYPRDRCIHQLFEAQVERTPDAVAITFEDEYLTYRELNRKANQLAHSLRELGVGPEVLVGLYLERSIEMIVALLGILKAGGAYVPLDPTYPSERLAFMLDDSQVSVLVTQQSLLAGISEVKAHVICMERDWNSIARMSAENLVSGVKGENLVYVIYTSGSTGRPKGVAVEQKQLLNYLHGILQRLDLPAGSSFATISTLATDLGNTSIFPSLCTGGCLHVISRERATDAHALADYFQYHPIDCLKITPSHLAALQTLSQTKPIMPLRRLIIGGEASSLEWVNKLQALAPECMIFNHYGPTETTVGVLTYRVEKDQEQDEQSYRTTPLGRPIANTQIYLLDQYRCPVPIGVPGEVYIGGASVARGYLNQPKLTTERFIPDPFCAKLGARLYKTGDLARYLPDGNIEFLGRIDDQIKLRGFRIELGEIEAVLRQHPAVHEAVVVAREDTPGDKRLTAYVIPQRGQAISGVDLQSYIRNHVPNYMVPSAVVLLEAFPLTPNGKIDRRSLPAPAFAQEVPAQERVGPRTPLEAEVAQIWSQVMGINTVDIHADFFALGGHSLLALQMITHLRASLHIELSLRSFFQAPTVAGLAAYISQQREVVGKAALAPAIQAVSREPFRRPLSTFPQRQGEGMAGEVVAMPMSLTQQGLWLVNQLEADSTAYHLPLTLRLHSGLELTALEQSLQLLVQRHEALRTTFALVDGEPMQLIAPLLNVPLATVDMRGTPLQAREDELLRLVSTEIQCPFDLVRGPLLRATLFSLEAEEHVLLLVMHHIISDGWSVGVICRELASLYEACAAGRGAELAPLPIQYADFALWQREQLQGERLVELLAYWKQQLAGAPPLLELPVDHPRPTISQHKGAARTFRLSRSLSEGLKQLSRQEGVTLYMLLIAAFLTLLHRYTGQEDIVIGTVTAGRSQQESRDLIGYFVNTLALRGDLGGNPTVRELLVRVREKVLEVQAYQEMPFEWLVKELQPERSLSQHPLFQVMLTLDPPLPESVAQWELAHMAVKTGSCKFDLALTLAEQADGLAGTLEYSTELFEEASMTRLLTHWETLLAAMIADPAQRVDQLALLTRTEREQLLQEWNEERDEGEVTSCAISVPQLLERQVERSPDALALVYKHERLTYQELNGKANQLARHLQKLGVGPEVLVGICLERSLEMVIGILAILKAGGAYVPLDPAYPPERLAFLLEDSQAQVLLTHEHLLPLLPERRVHTLCLDAVAPGLAQEATENLLGSTTADNLAYMIYTSGSTGKPKGVLVTHRNLLHSTAARIAYYKEPVERFLLLSSFAFDSSVAGIFWTLCTGGALVLPRADHQLEVGHLAEIIAQNQVSHMLCLPALYMLLLEQARLQQIKSLRTMIVAGEACPVGLVKQHFQLLPQARLFNEYGPTEGSVWCSVYNCRPEKLRSPVPIGRPIANTQIYLLDAHLQPVPIGAAGELYIGGAGVARGYHKRPQLTAERFLPDPFSQEPGARLYKTGDLARYLPDGTIEFLGRIDQQVKIRGFRIELGEIEAVLAQHPSVRQAVVVAREDVPGDKRLVAYLVTTQEPSPAISELRSFLKEQLPEYMLPSAFVFLEALPLTSNGKVDHRALPALDTVRLEQTGDYVAPRTPAEEILASIWAQVLHLERVSIHDNFFDLGGHSLLAAQIIIRLHNTFQIDLPMSTIFRSPTIADLTVVIEEMLMDEIEELDEEEVQRLTAI